MENNHLVIIEVFINADANKACFNRELWLHPHIAIPFNKITETMRFLYGNNCVVRFSSSIVDNMSLRDFSFINNNNV